MSIHSPITGAEAADRLAIREKRAHLLAGPQHRPRLEPAADHAV